MALKTYILSLIKKNHSLIALKNVHKIWWHVRSTVRQYPAI